MSQSPKLLAARSLLIAALAALPVLFTAAPTFAANRQAKERAARKACLGGDYTKGVNILAELFVETKDPTHIFNQGRCFEQNRRYEDAAARFEEYLRTPDVEISSSDRAAAEKHIAECKDKLPKERSDSPLQPAPPPVVAPTPPPAPEPAPQEPATAAIVGQTAPQPVEGQRRWGLVTAGIITSVVGVGGVAAGLIFNLKANSTVNSMETELGAYAKKNGYEKNYRTIAWIGYGAGAACAVVGAILIGVGAARSTPGSSTDVAFVPAVGPSQVGAMLVGGF